MSARTKLLSRDESPYAPSVCWFWQPNRVPPSPRGRPGFERWSGSDTEEFYERRGNKEFSVESVGYEFNNLGYRGPELDREPGERAVLVVGDSNTFGMGMPWDRLWTSLVIDHLERRWGVPVRQCNLAWGATGTDYAAMIVHQSVEVLKPDAVFVLWSFITRMTWFADPQHPVYFIREWVSPDYPDEHASYLTLATRSHGFFNYVRNAQFLYSRLAQLGVPYYWGNLEEFSDELLAAYLPRQGYVGTWKELDRARDGLHGGVKTHEAFAARVMAALERDALTPGPEGRAAVRVPAPVARAPRPRRLKRLRAVARPLRRAVRNVRLRRRIRAMKRRDPFIY